MEDSNDFQLLQLFAFETTLLMEILVVSFYITRKFKTQMFIFCGSFLSLNAVIVFGIVFKIKFLQSTSTNNFGVPNFTFKQNEIKDYLKTLANIVFLIYFTTMYIIASIEVFGYDLSSKLIFNFLEEAWTRLIEEKRKILDKENPLYKKMLDLEENKIDQISKEFYLKGVYIDCGSQFFFKKSKNFIFNKM